jgi:hypothetical protein
MKVFVSKSANEVWVQIRAEGQGAIGDLTQVIKSDGSFLGHPYEWWVELPEGEHDVLPA